MKIISTLIFLFFSVSVLAEINLYSDKKFMGCLDCGRYDSDSICNEYGNYGSKYSSDSVFNEYGTYGSKYSSQVLGTNILLAMMFPKQLIVRVTFMDILLSTNTDLTQ